MEDAEYRELVDSLADKPYVAYKLGREARERGDDDVLLRCVLSSESGAGFSEALDIVQRLDGDRRGDALVLIENTVQAWDVRSRPAPASYVDALTEGRRPEHLRLVAGVDIATRYDDLPERFVKLLQTVEPGELRALEVTGFRAGRIGRDAFDTLMAWPGLEHLETLRLTHQKLGNDAAIAIARNPACANLKILSLWDGSVTNKGAQALLKSKHLGKLTSLNLSDCSRIGDPTVRTLFEGHNLTALTELNLDQSGVGRDFELYQKLFYSPPEGLTVHLFDCPGYRKMKELGYE